MCGIAGLFLKNQKLEPKLGSLLAEMLVVLTDRGPDSTGFAIYGGGSAKAVKVTLRASDDERAKTTVLALEKKFGNMETVIRSNHVVLSVPLDQFSDLCAFVSDNLDDVAIVGSGSRMEIYKEVGLPIEVSERFDLACMSGTHAIGHTRMATESAVTTRGAHPFSTGRDQCLVHNGSLSNHNGVRRGLRREGLSFATENDSEVAAGYLTWRMREGASLKEALTQSLRDLDGFYTFVVATESGFAVLRDPIACKPAIMAETDDYVAFGTEYRALAVLPGIEKARVFEPEPATVYTWERH
jgi:methylamine---glutamate N-methyltransferase subunit A